MRNKINFYTEFKSWYRKILNDFNFNPKMDKKARNYLSNILLQKETNWQYEKILDFFKNQINSKKNILIYGCGPTLEMSVNELIDKFGREFFKDKINLAADGASVLLKKNKISIDGLFTDLDGISEKEFNYSNFVIIHAHGDNIDNLKRFKDNIINFDKIIGTTQAKPCNNIINPGGFTDGDRILYFIRNLVLPSQKIFLFGMDFGNKVGRYSKPYLKKGQDITPAKVKKLHYAVKLIESIVINFKNKIYFVNSQEISKKFQYLSLPDFEKLTKF